MNPHDKGELGSRLKRIAGQVAGIQRMLDEDRPLLEVVTQLSAVRAALGGVANIVLASHVEERPKCWPVTARASDATWSVSWCGCSKNAIATDDQCPSPASRPEGYACARHL